MNNLISLLITVNNFKLVCFFNFDQEQVCKRKINHLFEYECKENWMAWVSEKVQKRQFLLKVTLFLYVCYVRLHCFHNRRLHDYQS